MTPISSMHAHPPTPRRRAGLRLLASALAAAAAASTFGCGHGKDYLWVNQVPPGKAQLADSSYRITTGDVIGVRVWNQDSMSTQRARVRDDGKISLPFLNDVEVAGMEPAELARRLEVKLKAFIVNPVVTVTIEELRPLRVTIVGEIARAGVYELEGGAGVLNAIAAAGGLTTYAKRDRIFVLRQGYWADANKAPARIRFRYAALAAGKAPEALFRLVPGDTVVVE